MMPYDLGAIFAFSVLATLAMLVKRERRVEAVAHEKSAASEQKSKSGASSLRHTPDELRQRGIPIP